MRNINAIFHICKIFWDFEEIYFHFIANYFTVLDAGSIINVHSPHRSHYFDQQYNPSAPSTATNLIYVQKNWEASIK